MSNHVFSSWRSTVGSNLADPKTLTIDPERLQRWFNLAIQILPFFLAFFQKPTPPSPPPPVQSMAMADTPDEVFDYVISYPGFSTLSASQQQAVLISIEALSDLITV